MKKTLFAMMIVAGTFVFTSCEKKATTEGGESNESVVDRDTTVTTETDTTVTETVVETDTTTREVGGADSGESKDTVKKQ